MGLAQDPGFLLSCQSSRSDSGHSVGWAGATKSLSVVLAPPQSEQASPGTERSELSPDAQGLWLRGRAWALLVRQLGCALRMLLGLAHPVALTCVIWASYTASVSFLVFLRETGTVGSSPPPESQAP